MLDGAAEDVAEQQHEHDRLHRREEQRLGDAGDGQQVAPGQGQGVRDEPAQLGEDARRSAAPRTRWGRRWRWSCVLSGLARAGPARVRQAHASAALLAWRQVVVLVGLLVGLGPVTGQGQEDVVEARLAQVERGRARCPRRRGTAGRAWRPADRCRRSPRPGCRSPARRGARGRRGWHRCAGRRRWRPGRPRGRWPRGRPSSTPACPRRSPGRGRGRPGVLARRSASSRYWVVSSTVVPPPTSCSMTSHRSLRLCGSRPVVGSSRKSTVGRATRAAARSRRRRMPPEYVLSGRSPASVRLNWSSSSTARLATNGRRQVVELADHLQVLAAGQVLVDGGVLAGQADERADQRRLLDRRRCRAPGPSRRRAGGWWSAPGRRWSCPSRSGPSRPKTVPSSTAKLTPSRARTSRLPLNVFCRLSTSMAVVMARSIPSWRCGWRSGARRACSVRCVRARATVAAATESGGLRYGASIRAPSRSTTITPGRASRHARR